MNAPSIAALVEEAIAKARPCAPHWGAVYLHVEAGDVRGGGSYRNDRDTHVCLVVHNTALASLAARVVEAEERIDAVRRVAAALRMVHGKTSDPLAGEILLDLETALAGKGVG